MHYGGVARKTSVPLARFSALTREWFAGTFVAPTAAQTEAWDAIANGDNTLVIAPTGSGKTLAAFLWAIDRLATGAAPAVTRDLTAPAAALDRAAPRAAVVGTRVLYVSPLKALAVDVERNLSTPLTGISRIAERAGVPAPSVTVGVRSGDTPPNRRRELIAKPPDILITTPESLFLMLTSAARETLAEVDTVIVDEVHAVAGTKRGAHLALSLERLDQLLDKPAQRIGLSATVRPPEEVARFLSGQSPTTIVAPMAAKTFDLSVQVPVPNMANLENNSIWPDVEDRIVDLIEAHQSCIVFANSRRLAERLTARLNEIHAERTGAEPDDVRNPKVGGGAPAQVMGSGQTYGAEPLLAKAHHGSISKEQRALVEDDLKSGRLKAVVATSSLELGIDMGAVDLVIQIESPPSVASGLQRIGRAGHQVGEVSRGVLLPKHRTDLIDCAVTVQRMLAGEIETMRVPTNPLDVLAQHTIAAAALEPLDADRWFDAVRRSAPFASLPRSAFEATLDLLSGKYPSTEFAELRPRLVYDRDAGTLTARPGAQRLAVTSGGAIPDRGMFTVYLASSADAEKPSRVGELDEEMVYESRPGDVISLGATSWRITEITHDRVLVLPAPGQPARLPFWRGDGVGRPAELGAAIGAFTGALSGMARETFDAHCQTMGFNDYATENLWQLLAEQREATGTVPTDTTFIVERFRDELGDWRVILHSPYGLRVHGPLALAVARRLRERYGIDEKPTASDDGIIVRLPDTEDTPPGADLFVFEADEIEPIVTEEVGGSALFASRFRECAARALLLPRRHPGKRSPLWHQRQRAAQLLDVARKYPEFPIVLETVRECLQDVYDVPTLCDVMKHVAQRRIRILEVQTPTPSPFAVSLLFGYIGAFMYEGDSPLAERRAAALSLDSTLLAELLGRIELRELLDPQVIESTVAQLRHLAVDRAVRDAEGGRRPAATVGSADRDRGGGTIDRRRRRRLAGGSEIRSPRPDDVLRGSDVVGRHRRRGPASRRRGHRSARRHPGELHRIRRRSRRGPPGPLCPHPRPVHHPRGRRAFWSGPAGGGRRTEPDGDRPQVGAGRVHHPRRRGRSVESRRWRTVVRRRCSQDPATAFASRAARPGRTGEHCGVCPVPTRLAAGGRREEFGRRRTGRGDRATVWGTDSGVGRRAAGIRATGAQLPAGHARRTAGRRRGDVVRSRLHQQR